MKKNCTNSNRIQKMKTQLKVLKPFNIDFFTKLKSNHKCFFVGTLNIVHRLELTKPVRWLQNGRFEELRKTRHLQKTRTSVQQFQSATSLAQTLY